MSNKKLKIELAEHHLNKDIYTKSDVKKIIELCWWLFSEKEKYKKKDNNDAYKVDKDTRCKSIC